MPELRVAVVGCGGIGSVHLQRWANLSGARVAAICDVDAGTAHRVATEFEAEGHTDWESMLEGADYDVVDVCTPPRDHASIATKALHGGMNVLCEKPLARTLEEARAMQQAAESAGKLLMVAFCHRFHPPILFARELIQNDDLGRIVMFRNRFSGLFTGVESKWFSDPDLAGGGALMDTAVHSIDLFRYLVGEAASVSGRIATYSPALRVEDSAALVLQAENGALGVIEASWATPGGCSVVELYGTAGACFVDYDSGQVRYQTADMSVWGTREPGGPDRFQREIDHFADAVRGLTPLAVTGQDGVRANEIIDSVYRAQ